VHDLEIDDPAALEAALNHLPGIVTNGLFALRPADRLLMDADGQIQTYRVGQR
jgi:ribose 5-phosphate isomerase A